MSACVEPLGVDDFREALLNVIKASSFSEDTTKTTLFVWKNEAHLREWVKKAPTSDDIRVLVVKRSCLPMLEIKGLDASGACLVSLAYGVEANLSDIVAMFTMAIKKTKKPSPECQKGKFCNNLKKKEDLEVRTCVMCTGLFCSACMFVGKHEVIRTPCCRTCYYNFCG